MAGMVGQLPQTQVRQSRGGPRPFLPGPAPTRPHPARNLGRNPCPALMRRNATDGQGMPVRDFREEVALRGLTGLLADLWCPGVDLNQVRAFHSLNQTTKLDSYRLSIRYRLGTNRISKWISRWYQLANRYHSATNRLTSCYRIAFCYRSATG